MQVESVIVGSTLIPAVFIWLINLVRLANVVPVLFMRSETELVSPTVLHQNGIASAMMSPLAMMVAVPGASSQYGNQPVITGSAGIADGVVSVIGVIGSLPQLGNTITATTEIVVTQLSQTLVNFILVLIGYISLDTADTLEIFVDLD